NNSSRLSRETGSGLLACGRPGSGAELDGDGFMTTLAPGGSRRGAPPARHCPGSAPQRQLAAGTAG
ncbi:MAG: hypothetical protein ACRD2F_14955, partial [Terriglobales bacterium]